MISNFFQKHTESKVFAANLNRDKSPGRMDKVKYDKSKATPTPTTYKIEKKNLNTILSTKERVFEANLGKVEKGGKKLGKRI